jgi:hypothetical protein
MNKTNTNIECNSRIPFPIKQKISHLSHAVSRISGSHNHCITKEKK